MSLPFVTSLRVLECLGCGLVAIALAACDAPSGEAPAPAASPSQAIASAAAVAPTPVESPAPEVADEWPASEPPGPLYVRTDDGGLSLLDVDGKTKRVGTVPHVDGLHRVSDRRVFASVEMGSTLAIHVLDGTSSKQLPALDGLYSPGSVALDARGEVVAVVSSDLLNKGMPRLSILEGKTWKTEDISTGISSVDAVAVGERDEVWIAGVDGVAVRSGGAWKKLTTPDPPYLWSRRGFGRVGDAVIVHVEQRGEWGELKQKGDSLVGTDAALDWSTTGLARNGIKLIETGQTQVRARRGKKAIFFSPSFRVGNDSVVDGSYRVWTVVDNGLAVVDLRNETVLATYPQGAKELPSLTGNVELAVVGGGPSLPGKVSSAIASSVTGKLSVNGRPLAKVSIRICPDPSGDKHSNPCKQSKPMLGADTDENGSFVIKDVPNGKYGLTFITKTSTGGTQWVTDRGTFEIVGTGDVRVEPRTFTMSETPY